MRFLVAALFALGLAASQLDAASVTVLDSGSFDSYVTSQDISLVEFFAPWCGHCKKLAPEFETAATELQDHKIALASVDCTVEKDLCSQYDVSGFPTLKVFRKTKTASEYNGGRTAPEIIKYMKKQVEPAYTPIDDAASLTALLSAERDGVLLVGVFPDDTSEDAKQFIAAANSLRNEHTFVLVKDVNHVKSHASGAVSPSVILLKADESDKTAPLQHVVHSSSFTTDAITSFIKSEAFPLVGEIGPENFQKYMDRGFPLVWIFVDAASPLTQPALTVARQVAALPSVKSSLSLVHLDGIKWAEHAKHFGLKSGELPGIVLEDREGGKNYIFPYSNEITFETLKSYADSYAAGTLQANVKSQEIPADNNGPVTTIVGKNFDQIVLDNDKDVLVEFYAPWCGHCKSLAPKYEALGKIFEDNDKMVIAQVDATENDTPAKIKGFPTLILYKAGDKSNPVTYEGERTETAIADWLRQNGNTFDKSAAPAAHDHDDHSGHSHDDL